MFWEAVWGGLRVLLHWETYIVGSIYLFIVWLPVLYALLQSKSIDDLGILGVTATQPFFSALGIIVCVCILFPIIIGESNVDWSLPWVLITSRPIAAISAIILILIAAMVAVFIPIVGNFEAFVVFVRGCIALNFVFVSIDNVFPVAGFSDLQFMPGWSTIIGIVIVGGVVGMLGHLAALRLAGFDLSTNPENIQQAPKLTIYFVATSVLGLIPVFIYGAWVGLQIPAFR